jgi:hypothetical protein
MALDSMDTRTHTHTHMYMCVCVCVCVYIYIYVCTEMEKIFRVSETQIKLH